MNFCFDVHTHKGNQKLKAWLLTIKQCIINVFQAQLIAQSIGQAFQVAYMEFLKANGIEDPSLMKEIDYQEVLNQQEIYGEELNLFSNKERQKEVYWYMYSETLHPAPFSLKHSLVFFFPHKIKNVLSRLAK